MGTKTDIQTKIATDLASGNTIPISDHRDVLTGSTDSILDNLYADNINDTNATTNVVTENAANKTYSLNFVKQGRKVTVIGFVRNNTGAFTSVNEIWCSITNTEFQQAVSPTYITGHSAASSQPIKFILATNNFAALDSVGINEVVEFNFTYYTNA